MRYVEMVVPRAAAFDSYSVMYVVIQTSWMKVFKWHQDSKPVAYKERKENPY